MKYLILIGLGLLVGAGLMAYWYFHNKKKMDAIIGYIKEEVKKNGKNE